MRVITVFNSFNFRLLTSNWDKQFRACETAKSECGALFKRTYTKLLTVILLGVMATVICKWSIRYIKSVVLHGIGC
jgi:hypothetical protein